MKTHKIIKSNAHQRRRKFAIDEINILRKFEVSHLIQDKIGRELTKLHSLWFKGSTRDMSNMEL